jgi:hypothetical protein
MPGFPSYPTEDWVAPDELREPTGDPLNNLIIHMLSEDLIGNDALSSVGQLISEHAEFNIWAATIGKAALSWEQLLQLSIRESFVIRDLYLAWVTYASKFKDNGRAAGSADQEYAQLRAGLEHGVREFRSMRRSEPPPSGAAPAT